MHRLHRKQLRNNKLHTPMHRFSTFRTCTAASTHATLTHAAHTRTSQLHNRLAQVSQLLQPSTIHPPLLRPPQPPIMLTPAVACDPTTPVEVLWHIARHAPHLRKWVIVNRSADANLLEFISQQGGPDVRETLELVLDSLEQSHTQSSTTSRYKSH